MLFNDGTLPRTQMSLSQIMKMYAQRKVGRRQPFPWTPAVHHQSLVFRTRLYDEKDEAPEEEAGWN